MALASTSVMHLDAAVVAVAEDKVIAHLVWLCASA